jgi:hypothetical protein
MIKGPMASNKANVIMIGEEGETNPSGPIAIRNNRLANLMHRDTTFVHNFGSAPVQLSGNVLSSDVGPLMGAGTIE